MIADGGNALERTEISDREDETQLLEFEAIEEMATYYCEMHPHSMQGEISTSNGTEESEEDLSILDPFSARELTGDQFTEPVETTAAGSALFGPGESEDGLHYVLLIFEIKRITQAPVH